MLIVRGCLIKIDMRRIAFFILSLVTVAIAFAAGGAKLDFSTTKHDFGTIHADKGPVTCEYKFTNTGTEPLIIISVTNGGCGCTKPDYPKEPIAPGKSGVIKIHFNPSGRQGEFRREVRVKSNAPGKGRARLEFSGVIIPK